MYQVYSAENRYTEGYLESQHDNYEEAVNAAKAGCAKDGRHWFVKSTDSDERYEVSGANVI